MIFAHLAGEQRYFLHKILHIHSNKWLVPSPFFPQDMMTFPTFKLKINILCLFHPGQFQLKFYEFSSSSSLYNVHFRNRNNPQTYQQTKHYHCTERLSWKISTKLFPGLHNSCFGLCITNSYIFLIPATQSDKIIVQFCKFEWQKQVIAKSWNSRETY